MCLALSVPWVLYHSFCRALNKQVPLLKLQLYKLKIYALTVCILIMCSRLPLTAFFWYARECVFVLKKKKKRHFFHSSHIILSITESPDQLALFFFFLRNMHSNWFKIFMRYFLGLAFFNCNHVSWL